MEEPTTETEVTHQEPPPRVQSTQHEHYMAWESRDIAVCTLGCGHGCSLNPDFFDIKEGKIVERNVL